MARTSHRRLSEAVLEAELRKARERFQIAKESGLATGTFDGNVWGYKGARLHFTEISARNSRSERQPPLVGRAAKVGRCFAALSIAAQVSQELAISRHNAFRWLARTIRRRESLWINITAATLNEVVCELKKSTSIATTYHRACSLSAFVDYLNAMTARVAGVEARYCERFIRWKHGVPNPIRSTLEITSEARETRRREKFEPNLHVALATARAMIANDQPLEPSPGYDRLRLEPLSFALALGLRVGEVCALPMDALEKDQDTGLYFVRVPTEKRALASATAVPEIWQDALCEAYTYLLEHCAEARARAQEIETSGFEFVRQAIVRGRSNHPLTSGRLVQFKVGQLDPEKYCFISELTSAFSLSWKEFASGGKFRTCQVPLARLVAARMVEWLDDRFKRWDWARFSSICAKTGNVPNISVLGIGRFCGASKSSVTKARWYIGDLRKFLARMREEGLFEKGTRPSSVRREAWSKRWIRMREKMLGHQGGGSCTVVDIEAFIAELGRRYASYLSRHFKEAFDGAGNASGGGFLGKRVRQGMEVRLSDHLIVLWEYQFTGTRALGILPRPILRSDFYNYLSHNAQKKTVFERLSILDDNQRPYGFTPHTIRRWVTTALLRSGPSETAIDLWMGRSPRQTRHYDYRTAKERAEYVRDRYLEEGAEPNDVLGRKVRFWRENGLSSSQIEQLVCEKLKVLHFTPWGGCSRELYISPCNKGLMCLRGFGTDSACPSFQIDPADLVARRNIEDLRHKYTQMLRVIEPRHSELAETLMHELNTSEPLDQHLAFVVDVVRGCNEALRTYDVANADSLSTGQEPE